MPDDNNALPELVELLVRVSQTKLKDKELEILPELRISSATVDGPDGLCFTVSLRRAWLSLDLMGLETVPGSRLGEPTKPNEVSVKHKTSHEIVTQNQITAQAGVRADKTSANVEIGLGGKHQSTGKTTSSTTSTEATPHIRVKARGNLMWEITDSPLAGELDGTFLNNEILCRVKPKSGANAKTIQLAAFVKQRDVLLRLLKSNCRFPFPSLNHEKMMKILIAKALSASGTKFNGTVEFSKSEIDIED